jgi:protein STU2
MHVQGRPADHLTRGQGADRQMNRTRSHTVAPLVEKGLSSTRAATKASALEALLLYIELDSPTPVIDDLIPLLAHKQPKIIAATLSALKNIYHAYGCKTADPKNVLKQLPKVFGHADKNVRAESTGLALEFYRWLKEAMKPMFWNDLKPVQQKELDDAFEKIKEEPAPKQERLLRSQQAAAAAAEAAGEPEAAEEEEEEVVVDVFDLAEPVDALAKAPADLQDQLASTKWKDRKEALDALYVVINVPRIKDNDYGEIVRGLAKSQKDANVAVVTVAANCVEVLAKGLRKSFGKYRSIIVGPLIERLKEKKQSVVDAIGGALDAVFIATGLTDNLEDTFEGLKHKNPNVKLETTRFLIRCLRTTRVAPSKPEVKSIVENVTKLLTESTEVMRSAAAEVLGTLMKIMGERSMNPYMEGLDDIRKTKIKEFYETAEVKAKDKPAAPPPPPPVVAKAGPKKKFGQAAVNATKGPPKKAVPPPSPAPVAVAPKAAPRAIPSKLGAPKALAGGPRLQKKLTGPGGAAPPTLSSPKRPVAQVQQLSDDEFDAPPVAPRGPVGRGLAGRPLGKPAHREESVYEPPAVASGLTALERHELEELRLDKERWGRTNDDLRAEKTKYASQIHELQNQNAQLIEDHTRDVLSIKAKETQLVRARSDAEAAEQMVQKQQREMDRLKRELARAVRATSPAPPDVSEQIYRDSGLSSSGRYDSGAGGYQGGSMSRSASKRMSFASSLSEEKENGVDGHGYRSMKMSPPLSQGVSSGTATGGRGSPISTSRIRSGTDDAAGENGGNGSGDGIESWKRAAEVTSQLKARIEQMKVS